MWTAINCKNGRIYLPCGPAVEPTCGSVKLPNKEVCNEGCFCPEGTVQHKDKCISPELCPCTLRNKEFKAGSKVQRDCNTWWVSSLLHLFHFFFPFLFHSSCVYIERWVARVVFSTGVENSRWMIDLYWVGILGLVGSRHEKNRYIL